MKSQILKIFAVCFGISILVFLGVIINRKLYENENIWDIALFRMDVNQNVFEYDYSNPSRVFSPSSRIRTRYHYVTGYADPFLFVDGEWLYIFYEKELFEANASICAMRTKDLQHFQDLGTVLDEPFHLSFPNVFREGDEIYMIPETRSQDAVILYQAINFPFEWKKERVLVSNGKYVDSSVIKVDGTWYLFTSTWRTENESLCIFTSNNLKGPYTPHPSNTLTNDRVNLRNGGGVFVIEDGLFRPAQNCANYYGENLDIYKIDSLSPTTYSEKFHHSMINKQNEWSRFGGHQFSTVFFNGERIVAMDGSVKDNWINNRTRIFFHER